MRTFTAEPEGGAVPRPPSTGPVAATWVAGTGAFLLLAAAAVFIAVSWDRLPEVAKLALVGGITCACIVGGRAVRRTLPATGDVVFHLGAFLLPVDVAGIGLRTSIGWRAIVVSEGLVGVGVLGALAAASGSVVLGWAVTLSMVVLAVGIAAVSPIPAVAALAVAAVGAHVMGDRARALAWSSVATFGPVLGLAIASAPSGSGLGFGLGDGVLADLGLDGGIVALAGCLAAAVVLGREARERSSVALAGLAVAGGLSGIASTWSSSGIPGTTTVLALPVLFLVAEVIASLCERDVFWRHPARAGAAVAELGAVVVGGAWTAALVLGAPFVETGIDLFSDGPGWVADPATGASLAALALGWAVAGLRRRPTAATFAGAVRAVAAPVTGVLCALAAVAAVEVGTASGPASAGAMLAVAAVLVWAASPTALVTGTALALWAPVAMAAASVSSLATLAAGAAATAVVGAGAVAAGQAGRIARVRLLAVAALAGAATGTALAVGTEAGPDIADGLALVLFVAQAWLLSGALSRFDAVAGHLGRLGMLTGVALALGLEPAAKFGAIALATALLAADALRLRDRTTGFAAAASVQALVATLSAQAGFDAPQTGLALVLSAVVWSGLAVLVDDTWRDAFVAAALLGVGAGVLLASGDQRMLADAVVVTGGLLLGAGVVIGRSELAHAGGVTATLGIWGHLSASGVAALDLYVAPVALYLVVAGWHGRRNHTLSSWTAYAPAVALLGGAALVERLDGGPAWHAILAGAVGVAAVALGGWHRLAGPLFLGTGLLAAVTVVECIGALAGVPTWAWLATGGSVLLGVGVALERADATPAEAGRRLVDVIAERFE